METEIKVLIADDHPIFRRGLREALEAEPSLRVVDVAEDGAEALRKAEALRPDVAVLDVEMPRLSGIEAAKRLREFEPPVEVIILTMYKDEDIFNQALSLGVKGYVLKDSAATDVIAGIRKVLAGEHYISPALSTFLVNRRAGHDALVREHPGLEKLTPTEWLVLRRIADYKTSKEIAAELGTSHRTVENHRNNISRKLNLEGGGSHALLRFAAENKPRLF